MGLEPPAETARSALLHQGPSLSDHPRNPTLLVGLGAFGRDVIDLAARGPARQRPNLACIEVREDGGEEPRSDGARDAGRPAIIEATSRKARDELRAMLDLEHFVEHTEPTDPRGPRCDVLLVGDLSEPGVASIAPALAAALAAELRAEFHGILRSGEGALCVCPLLCTPRSADKDQVAAAARALSAAAESIDPQRRLDARVYLVEDQSGKYLLSRAELVRSFAAFLHLLLFSGLRDAELGARGLIERAPNEGGPFATFACATLELDQRSLARLSAVRLAREILRRLREGRELTIAEIAAESAGIIPERGRLETDLWKESSAGTLEKHLEPPLIDVPEITWEDSPEDIVERKFNALFRARAESRIRGFREDVERFKMDRLAAEIEKSGKSTLERLTSALAERIEREVEAGPRGHARALEILRDARTRAKGLRDEVEAEIESPDLDPFPSSPLDAGVLAIHEAAFFRPRAFRMKIFGAIGIVLGTALTAGVILSVLRGLVAPDPPYFDPTAPLSKGWIAHLGRWPVPFAMGAVLSASSTSYRLWKHYKRHHNWAASARDSLDQALKKHLQRDVVSYFYRRLHYTRLLWVQRIYRRLVEKLDEAIATLEGIRAALAQADLDLGQEERALEDRLRAEGLRGGVLFRGLLSPEGARDIYEEIKPVDTHAAAERFLKEALAGSPWTAAPFAEIPALTAFCDKELARLDVLSPFKPDSEALFRCASDATRAFLSKLALKLSPPLATIEAARGEPPRGRHIAIVPEGAETFVNELFAEENVRGGWDVRGLSRDPRRIHLLIDRGGIGIDAIRALQSAGAPRTPAAGGGKSGP